jgi:hypothetical protein
VDRAGLDYTLPWHSQPKETIGKIIGAVSPSPFYLFIYLRTCSRLVSAIIFYIDSHTLGLLRNSSRLILRTSVLMHVNEAI